MPSASHRSVGTVVLAALSPAVVVAWAWGRLRRRPSRARKAAYREIDRFVLQHQDGEVLEAGSDDEGATLLFVRRKWARSVAVVRADRDSLPQVGQERGAVDWRCYSLLPPTTVLVRVEPVPVEVDPDDPESLRVVDDVEPPSFTRQLHAARFASRHGLDRPTDDELEDLLACLRRVRPGIPR